MVLLVLNLINRVIKIVNAKSNCVRECKKKRKNVYKVSYIWGKVEVLTEDIEVLMEDMSVIKRAQA